jgi:hypothetical protein
LGSTLLSTRLAGDRNGLPRITHFLNRRAASTGGEHKQEYHRNTAPDQVSNATGFLR